MAMTPLIPRTGILPMRVTPLLIPRLSTYAKRVRVHVHAWAGLPAVPEADLIPKLISGTFSPEGEYHEYYALMRGGDPEGFMDIHPAEEIIYCEVARTCGAAVDIYLDETLIASFPEEVPPGPWVGHTTFEIPSE